MPLRGLNDPLGAAGVSLRPRLGENPGTVKNPDKPLRPDTRLPADPHASDPPPTKRPVVLVVDDSRFVRASIARALGNDFALQQADSGERAWELLLLDDSIRAVLSDLTMPGIDGFELLRRVRGSMLDRIRGIPFAVLSGADEAEPRERARQLGADRFVVKGEGFDPMCAWLRERLATQPAAAGAARSVLAQATTGPSVSAAPPPAGTSSPVMQPMPADPLAPVTQSAPPGVPAAGVPAAGVPDPLAHWLQRLLAAQRTDDASLALLRLHAPGLPELPARLRRGVRAADALYQETEDTAWLCLPASAALAVRLALRFALLAGGRAADGAGERARVGVTLYALDPRNALAELAAAAVQPVRVGAPGQVALDCHAAAWGPAWTCDLPWPAARLMVAAP